MMDFKVEGLDVSKEAVQAEVLEMTQSLPDAQDERYAAEIFETAKNFNFSKDDLSVFEGLGKEVNALVATKSQMLNAQIRDFQQRSGEGSPLAKNLALITENIGILDPNKVDFNKTGGFLGKAVKFFNPIKRYFESFQTIASIIDKIRNDLKQGRDKLIQDNITMEVDTKRLVEAIQILTKQIRIIGRAKDLIMEEVNHVDAERKALIEEHIVYTLAQKEMDMHTLNNVAMQAVMAMNILIRNNKELIRQVNRVDQITLFAFSTAVTVALALADQKIVIEATKQVTKTTNDLISATASKLKQQGLEIHKQASESVVDVQVLKQSFADIKSSLDSIREFRTNAIPQINGVIEEFNVLSKEASSTLKTLAA